MSNLTDFEINKLESKQKELLEKKSKMALTCKDRNDLKIIEKKLKGGQTQ